MFEMILMVALAQSQDAKWYALSNCPGWEGYGTLLPSGWIDPVRFRKAETGSQGAPQPLAPASGDPHGFVAWLNATRAAYGLPAVEHDPDLSSWAAANNGQQATRGIGHFVMGPARRQNAAMGGYPGIEAMWMASPAHRSALLDPTIRWVGIAGLGAWWTFNAR